MLGRWLFQFNDPTMDNDHLEDPRKSFSLSDDYGRGMLLDEAMGRPAGVVRPTAVWRADVQTRGFYECHYEDVVFEESGRVVYLHAGVSD